VKQRDARYIGALCFGVATAIIVDHMAISSYAPVAVGGLVMFGIWFLSGLKNSN